ncbi:MAG: ABC transporter permease [Microbacteriaceae bacterium]|nr:ABC transporter permease [Microbacteriaceae bacterium]
MTTATHVVADSVTMTRRTLLHMLRYPALSVFGIGVPVIALLLLVFVFGGTLGAGLPGVDAGGGREAYLAYVIPGLLVLTVAGSAGTTATMVAMDMKEGIVARFRSMAISRAAVLNGHVLGNTVTQVIAVAIVLGVAVLIGFRPTATPLEWLAAIGLIVLVIVAIVWLGVAMGTAATSVESASNVPLLLVLLPMLGSGFVPTASMPGPLRVFAEWQPFTPIIEAIRSLLLGTPMGANGWLALGWCAVIAGAGYLWALALYNRKSVTG